MECFLISLPRTSKQGWLTYGGSSSVGRAPDCGSGCRGFESRLPPHSLSGGEIIREHSSLALIKKLASFPNLRFTFVGHVERSTGRAVM